MQLNKDTLKYILPLVVFLAGLLGAWALFFAKEKVKRVRPTVLPPLVEILEVEKKDEIPIDIRAMGTVKPERTISLRSQVSGRVAGVEPGFVPGGTFAKGALMLSLDPMDFKLEVQKQRARVARARAALSLEMGRQEVAREDLAMMQATTGRQLDDSKLALREPQMVQARADLDLARADLAQARLNLERTRILAPFNAIVLERNAHVGSRVGTSEAVAILAGTDTAWVETAVAVDMLARIQFDNGGSPARIRTASGQEFQGRVSRLKGGINPDTRMAVVIISVKDPFAMDGDHSPLLLESYVEVDIAGRPLKAAIALPRRALRNGKEIWVFAQGVLEKRRVTPVFSDARYVYLSQGLDQGEHLIVSDLPTPVAGMALRAVTGE
ncbi:MAG: efflux RND transporter periplasmic adaptor subunit [Desulfovibrionales bacterium]|nr:efflux RND transporter periplasmic adaptor subunit [Desulfovibrionales bacterium]